MKRIITILIALMLIFALTLPCCAEAKFETAGELYQSWARPDNFPDYVCGVWSTYGNSDYLTIAVQNTEEGNNGKLEILELIEDDSTVTFVYGEYSRNYLADVQNELMELFKTKEEHGLVGTALMDKENRISLLFLKEYEGNSATNELISDLTEEYGDIFTITYGDAPFEDTLLISPAGESITPKKNSLNLTTIVLVAILIFSISFMVVRKRRAYLLKANTGETLSSSAPFSDNQVEDIVKNTPVDYPKELDEKIMNAIDKSE